MQNCRPGKPPLLSGLSVQFDMLDRRHATFAMPSVISLIGACSAARLLSGLRKQTPSTRAVSSFPTDREDEAACLEIRWNHWIFVVLFSIDVADVNTVLTGAVLLRGCEHVF